jgi:hypothetical protein
MDHVAEMIEDLRYCRDVATRAGEHIDALEAENSAMRETMTRIANKQAYPSPFYKWVKDQVRADRARAEAT